MRTNENKGFESSVKRIARTLFTFLLLTLYSFSNAQKVEKFIAKAEEAYENADYYAAADYYQMGIEKYPENVALKYGLAESLRKYNDYDKAAKSYKDVVTDDAQKKYPLAAYWYAVMLRQQGKYDMALKQFEKLKYTYRGKEDIKDKLTLQIASCKWAIEHAKDTSSIKVIHLEAPVNTTYSEFNPFTDNKSQLFYSSLRKTEADKKFLGHFYGLQDSMATFLTKINKTALLQKHIANGHFTNNESEFFFTVCDDDAKRNCKIYFTAKADDWSKIEEVAIQNSDDYTNTHPFLAAVNSGEQTLYFVSDRSGSKGGTDIWSATRTGKNTYANPAPLVVINTTENELTPYFDADSNQLYFASEGWNGFGGLDIYKWKSNTTTPLNAGKKINSPANDFGFVLSADRGKAYFATNRKGSFFIKAETCCYDIWSYATGEKKLVKAIDSTLTLSAPLVALTVKDSLKVDTIVGKTTVVIKDTVPVITQKIDVSDSSSLTILQLAKTKTTTAKLKGLLPVTLYFHNDEPECCNLRDSTPLNYVTSYEAYWRLLNDYKSNFTKGLVEGKKTAAEQEIFYLFTDKVEKGYHDLIQFSAQLLDALKMGKKVSVTIQGYCSPLNYNEYNIKLGYRRIASLKNYFYHYRAGVFKPFIDNGYLILKNESIGEEKAAKAVSDSREDTRNSVYNPAAAVERKVEIISIELE